MSRLSLEAALGAVSGARADLILLPVVGQDFYVDLAKSLVRIRLRIVSHRVAVAQIFADGFKGLHLLLPRLSEVTLATGRTGDPPEDAARHGVFGDLGRGDNVDW